MEVDARQGGCLLVATDIASRGVDLPETTHIYNFELPRTAIDYLHRAGRTGRRPFSDEKSIVTTLTVPEERFVELLIVLPQCCCCRRWPSSITGDGNKKIPYFHRVCFPSFLNRH
ncbi:DEAD-box ATP-dependent RNA helicase 58 [Nymphaea thermarum]|nr:DEAD-box ATP-dependent RNA helicase 58 [Nymphaea thermarum]